jgi:hypothetical protein
MKVYERAIQVNSIDEASKVIQQCIPTIQIYQFYTMSCEMRHNTLMNFEFAIHQLGIFYQLGIIVTYTGGRLFRINWPMVELMLRRTACFSSE